MHLSLILGAIVSLASPPDIQKTIDAFVAKAPGVVVAVGVVDRGTAHEYFSGKPPSGAPALDETTEFQIGSITKTFTSTILADMVMRSEVKLDDPIAAYLPAGVKAPSFHGKAITLANLAEQNSGLPVLPTNFGASYATYDAAELYAFLNDYTLPRAPGAQFEYSNLGVGLLGTLLANAAKTTYPQLVQERILKPLGMANTSATIPPAIGTHMMPGAADDFTPQPPWTFLALAGAGAINSNLHDMLLYLQANIDAPAGTLGKAMALAHDARADGLPKQKIGLNWMIGPSGIVWHNGETGGYSSFLAFDPATKVGIVVLSNVAPGNGETDLLAAHLLEPTNFPTIVAIEPPAKPVGNSPFVGVYELSPTFRIRVFEDNGTLYGQASGQGRFPLRLQSGSTYAVVGVDASVTFVRNATGHVTSLILHQNAVNQEAKRIEP